VEIENELTETITKELT